MTHARRLFDGITIPQRLLLASAFVYGAVFAGLLAYGRPGTGIGGGFYVAVILAGAATSPIPGALAGALALFLYELAAYVAKEVLDDASYEYRASPIGFYLRRQTSAEHSRSEANDVARAMRGQVDPPAKDAKHRSW